MCSSVPANCATRNGAEIDFTRAVWIIPARKTKMGKDHQVPLSRQGLGRFLKMARKFLPVSGRYVFPSASSADRPMSENTLNGALRRMNFPERSNDRTRISSDGFDATQQDRASGTPTLSSARWPTGKTMVCGQPIIAVRIGQASTNGAMVERLPRYLAVGGQKSCAYNRKPVECSGGLVKAKLAIQQTRMAIWISFSSY